MKKIGILLLAAGVLFSFSTINSFAQDTALKVTAMNGKVLVKVYPATAWSDLALGQMIHPKDMIKTEPCDKHPKGKNNVDEGGNACPECGAVTLELPDKSSVALKTASEISISELVMDNAARKLNVNMTKGEMRMIVAKVGTLADFSVKTPNAIYDATGTIFYVSATGTGTSVYVADGSINMINPITGQVFSIVAGSIMTFNSNGSVIGPIHASNIHINNWTAHYLGPIVEPYMFPFFDYRHHVNPPDNHHENPCSGH